MKGESVEEHMKHCSCNMGIFSPDNAKILESVSSDGWWDWHLKEDWEYMSPRFWEIMGHDHATKTHHPSEWQQFIHPEDMKLWMGSFKKHVASHGQDPESISHPVRYTTESGNQVWVMCRGKVIEWDDDEPVRMIGSHVDIDSIKRSEVRLAEEKQRFSMAFDNSLIGVCIVGLDGKFIEVNNVICDIFGYSKDEMTALSFQDVTHEDDLKTSQRLLAEFLADRKAFVTIKKRYVRKNGEPICANLSVSLVRDVDGNPLYFISQIQDITDKENIREKILKSTAELRGIIHNGSKKF